MPLVLIGLGGFVGAATRYIVDGVVSDRTGGSFPFGTLVVNGSGSLVLELLFAMIGDGLVTLERVEVVAYRGTPRQHDVTETSTPG